MEILLALLFIASIVLGSIIFIWLANVLFCEIAYRKANPVIKFTKGDLVALVPWRIRLDPFFYTNYAHAERKEILKNSKKIIEIRSFSRDGNGYTYAEGRGLPHIIPKHWLTKVADAP